MIKKNSTFVPAAAAANRMTGETQISFGFVFFAAVGLVQTTVAPAPPAAFEVASAKSAAQRDELGRLPKEADRTDDQTESR
jgi:hypothetical protein